MDRRHRHPALRNYGNDQVFGATVTYRTGDGATHTITIVGIDEFDPLNARSAGFAHGAHHHQCWRARAMCMPTNTPQHELAA